MDEQTWRNERDDRSLRYTGRVLNPNRWIVVTADQDYAESYEGQIALLTATNLLSRMTPSVALGFSDAKIVSNLPWANRSLHETVLGQMKSADPHGRFSIRSPEGGDFRLHFGRDNHDFVVHGEGWNAYCGPSPSPLPAVGGDDNPIGPALAAIISISQVFAHDFQQPAIPVVVNGLTWDNCVSPQNLAIPMNNLGDIWIAGVGSVGTAALYFLVLSGRAFGGALIDKDKVKRHNLDRSPIFIEADVGDPKVKAALRFLNDVGIDSILIDSRPLHESTIWTNRSTGTPDILISAANELNARYHIESQYPPIQLYGTTGRNWQASLIRHVPFQDACSCCLFPQEIPQPAMTCASAPISSGSDEEQQIDAALPFLSFAAGLMTTAEILKLSLPGYPYTSNRIFLNTRPTPRLLSAPITRRAGCICLNRSEPVHQKMLQGTKYRYLVPGQSEK